jgi:phosphatidate cytidylyltransferase
MNAPPAPAKPAGVVGRRTRVLAAAVMAPVAILGVLFLPSSLLAAAVGGLMMFGLWEWSALAGLTERVPRAAYLSANALLMAALAWGAGPALAPIKLIALLGVPWWMLVSLWMLRFDFASADKAWTRLLKLCAGTFSVLPAWAAMYWLHHGDGGGASGLGHDAAKGPVWTLFVLLIVWAADTGAYFVGVRFGRRKLAPRISPGKSWEGLFGGLGATLLLALAMLPLLGLKWPQLPQLLLLTLITALVSVLGDLFESLLKRHAGAKDSSDLIPGHGGMLDRIDSLLAALPVFVLCKIWLEL